MSCSGDGVASSMKALVCERLGQPQAALGSPGAPLRLARLPPPDLLHPSSVRIKVAAGALNFADALTIKGEYQEKPKLPFIPGNECSGTVVACGRDVRTVAVGDKVCALTQGGAFAEEVVVREQMVIKLPQEGRQVDLEAAAGLPVAFGTAYLALKDRAQLQAGQALLVLGAAGGVGLAAVQLGKAFGARVVAVARGARKAAVLREAGADQVIDMERHKAEELRQLVRQTAPQGIDVVFDPVGGPLLTEALRCVRWGAHILIIGFAAGLPKLPPNVLLVKNVTVHGVYWGSYAQHQPRAFRRSLDEVARLLAAGSIRVHVSHIYSLEQAPEAFSVLLNRQVIGKILMVPGPRSAGVRAAL